MTAPVADAPARRLGVLGGMGPLAGAAFALRVVQLTPAQRDQEHIPVMLYNDPSVPDRSSAYMAGGPSPLPAMLRGIGTLIAAGADCIATPCNTAHLWFDDMQAASSKPMLHIVDAVIEDLQRRGVRGGPIGILGTPATIALGLYQKGLRRAGFDVVEPIEEEVAQFCVPAIAAVKANRPEDGFAPCADGIRRLAARGRRPWCWVAPSCPWPCRRRGAPSSTYCCRIPSTRWHCKPSATCVESRRSPPDPGPRQETLSSRHGRFSPLTSKR